MSVVMVIAGDRKISQGLGEALMGWRGCDLILRSNGRNAISDIAAGLKVDIALIDDRSPDMDGIGVITSMKRAAPDVPVIVVSNQTSVDHYLRMVAAGAHECLIGPVNDRLLRRAVTEAMRVDAVRHTAEADG